MRKGPAYCSVEFSLRYSLYLGQEIVLWHTDLLLALSTTTVFNENSDDAKTTFSYEIARSECKLTQIDDFIVMENESRIFTITEEISSL